MPKVRRREVQRRVLSLSSFAGAEVFDFLCGWHPALLVDGHHHPPMGCSTWSNWSEFFSDYGAIREELLAVDEFVTPWAESPYQEWLRDGTIPELPVIIGPTSVRWADPQ